MMTGASRDSLTASLEAVGPVLDEGGVALARELFGALDVVDEHGALMLLSLPDLARAFPARLKSERDRWMLVALIRLLPTAVATAAREVVSDPQEYGYWVDLAKRMAAALPRGGD